MRKRSFMLGSMVILGIFLVMLTMAPAVFGQSTATLTGIVMDQSKAIVPNATIVLIDEATNDTRRSVSNNDGLFVFTALPAKTYKVRVEMKGFQNWERIGIVLHPSDKVNIDDIIIMPGSESQTITVSAEAGEIVPVDSGEKGQVISATQIQNLSIVGRDATELLKILPGMVMSQGGVSNSAGYTGEYTGINGNGAGGKQSAIGNYSANGSRNDAVDIQADGVHVSDPGCNCASPVTPNVDMIQEFKVQTSNFTAENSKGPVIVSSVAKSGTSEFHGEAYYTGRRHELNSEEYFAKANKLPKPESNFAFPGGNIGGPVIIPGTSFNKDKNKLFFFFGVEWLRQNIDTGVHRAVVPTDANRNLDFSNSDGQMSKLGASNGARGVPNSHGWVNGIATAGAIDPSMLALYKGYYPKAVWNPDEHGGYNWGDNAPVTQNMNMQVLRTDYSISDNTKLYARYQRQREAQPFTYGLWWDESDVPLPSKVVGQNSSQSISVNLAHVFSPTMTNEFVFGYTYVDFPNVIDDPSKMSKSALGYTHTGLFKSGVDLTPGFVTWAGPSKVWLNGGFNPVLYATKHLASVGDNITKVMGTHTLKFGGYWEHIINKQPGNNFDNGYIVSNMWSSNSTGNDFADFMSGRIGDGWNDASKNIVNDEGYHVIEGYIQDSWKARPNLTFELGLRASHLGQWSGRHGASMATFDPSTYSNAAADLDKFTGIQEHYRNSKIPLSGAQSRFAYYQPRVGVAYSLFKNTVLRGGFGTYYYHDAQNAGPLGWPPLVRTGAIGPAQGVYDVFDVDNATPSVSRQGITVMNYNDDKMPVTYNWNFTISHRLPKQMLLEVSYVGNKSANLLNNAIDDMNYIAPGSQYFDYGTNINWDSYRPMQNYSNVSVSQHTQISNYNSLQALLARQTGRFTYSFAYTFGKALGYRNGGWNTGNIGAAGNAFTIPDQALQRKYMYGPLAYDRTHTVAIAYSWLMPDIIKGNGAGYAVGKAVINGWQFSGISTISSGGNLQAYRGNFDLSVTETRPDASAGGAIREVTIGQGQVVGTNGIPLMPILTCDPRSNLKSGQYINGDCIAAPYWQHNGDFIWPYVRGPYFQNHDLAVYKNFRVGKNENRKIQLRFSAFNFLNHPLVSFRDDSQALDLNFLDGARRNQGATVFGYPESKAGKRIVSFAAKFYF